MKPESLDLWRTTQVTHDHLNALATTDLTYRIISSKDISIDTLSRLRKSKLNHIYQQYLKKYSITRNIITWLWRTCFPVYIKHISPLLKKESRRWMSLVSFSVKTEHTPMNRYELTDQSVVKTTLLAVFPNQDQHYLGSKHDQYVYPAVFVTTVQDAMVYGGTNLIKLKNQVLCHDLYHFAQDYTSEELHGRIMIHAQQNRIRWILHDDNPAAISMAATFVDSCASNYAHWLTEVLPKICLFCTDNRFDGIPIIVNSHLHDNLKASLFLLSGDREVIFLPIGRAIQVEHLYFMSPTGYVPFEKRPNTPTQNGSHGIFSPYAFKMLRDQLTKKLPLLTSADFPKRIYLRRVSNTRKLLNESEIETLLVEHGFSIIATERLSFAAQVALFQHADVIIGPTGAACANIIFSNPQANIAILMAIHKNMPYRYWLNMSNAAGVKNISYILGKITQNKALDFHGDYTINIQDVACYLNTLESA